MPSDVRSLNYCGLATTIKPLIDDNPHRVESSPASLRPFVLVRKHIFPTSVSTSSCISCSDSFIKLQEFADISESSSSCYIEKMIVILSG